MREGEHPRAAEESQGAQRSQGGSPRGKGHCLGKAVRAAPRERGDEERDRQIPLKRSIMQGFFYKDSWASV